MLDSLSLSIGHIIPYTYRVAANPRVNLIMNSGELLRKAKFGEFWTTAKDVEDFSKVC